MKMVNNSEILGAKHQGKKKRRKCFYICAHHLSDAQQI